MRRVSRPAPKYLLLSNYDYGEGAGLDFAATLAWGRRLKLGAGQKDLVRFQIEAHGARTLLGCDRLDHRKFVGGIFVDDGEVAVAAGGKEIIGRGIKGGSVRALADGRCGDDLARIHVDNGGDFVIAYGQEAAALEIT